MTVAGKAQLERQVRDVAALGQPIQRAAETQQRLVPIQRYPFRPLEALGQVDGGDAKIGRDLRQAQPAIRTIVQHGFGAANTTLVNAANSPPVRNAFFEDCDTQFFRCQRLADPAKELRQHLHANGARAHAHVPVGARVAPNFIERLIIGGEDQAAMANPGQDMAIYVGFSMVGEEQSRAVDPSNRPADLTFEGAAERDDDLASSDIAARRQLRPRYKLLGDQ